MKRFWFCVVVAVLMSVSPSTSFAREYLLRSGDMLEVTVWQDQKLNRQVLVGPDGRITLPLAGHVQAAGRGLAAVEGDIRSRLQSKYNEVDVTVALIKERPAAPILPKDKPIDPSFYVTGEVLKPGQFSFNQPTSVIQAIASAGGLGPFAAEHRIKVRRKVNGVERLYDFDYANFTSGADMSGNIRLKGGDVIIVPEKRLFE